MMIKQRTRWRMQVLLFLMITVLAITGLIDWLLPRGGEARALRHLLRWIHEGAAVGFLTFVAAHLYFQSEMIRHNLRRFSLWGRD